MCMERRRYRIRNFLWACPTVSYQTKYRLVFDTTKAVFSAIAYTFMKLRLLRTSHSPAANGTAESIRFAGSVPPSVALAVLPVP